MVQADDDTIFPASPRVIYEQSPLVEVISQIRFPSILRIEAEVPAAFQESIRGEFPLFEREARPQLPPQVPEEVARLLGTFGGVGERAVYVFLTEGRDTKVTLTPGSIALSTTQYTRWEEFRRKLERAIDALTTHYRPGYFTRIGLRYVDLIIREKLGLTGRRWAELLDPRILGELQVPAIEAGLEECQRTLRFRASATMNVGLRHGLARAADSPDPGYLIDFDFYTAERTEVTDALTRLDAFNRGTGRAFRWCITDVLQAALRPLPI